MVKKVLNQKERKRRLLIAISLILFFLTFILINVKGQYQAGLIFLLMMGVSGAIIINWEKIPKKRPDRKLFSFGDKWIRNFFIGVGIGLVITFILVQGAGLVILVPQAPQAVAFPSPFAAAGQYLTVVGAASLVEELTFRVVIFAIFWIVIGYSYFTSALVSSAIFSAFHINAYAGSLELLAILGVAGSFFAAFAISMLFFYTNKFLGDVAGSIGTHATVNGGIISQQFIVFG